MKNVSHFNEYIERPRLLEGLQISFPLKSSRSKWIYFKKQVRFNYCLGDEKKYIKRNMPTIVMKKKKRKRIIYEKMQGKLLKFQKNVEKKAENLAVDMIQLS